VLAHPERCRSVARDPSSVAPLVERGGLLCLNAGSLVGDHGAAAERTGWRLVEDGVVAAVASDGHRAGRPPAMTAGYEAAVARLGEVRALPLFDGSALPWADGLRARRTASAG
jgi:protein-tyrosine phosphatase